MASEPLAVSATLDELAVLLHIGGITPSPSSPLASCPPRAPSRDELHAVDNEGWLESLVPPCLRLDALTALQALSSPTARVKIALGTGEGLKRWELFRARREEWVGWQSPQNGNEARLEIFHSNESLLSQWQEALDLSAMFLRPRFAATLDWNRFQVLLGLLDVYRAASLRAILDRNQGPPPTFNADEVFQALEDGRARPHFYWAASLGRMLAPDEMTLRRPQAADVLTQLAAEGFLHSNPVASETPASAAFRPGRSLTELAVSLLLVPAFLSVTLRSGRSTVHLTLIRGANTLWRLYFSSRAPYTVDIEPRGGDDVMQELCGLLAHEGAPAEEAQPIATPARCPQCGHQPEAEARFCALCGTPLAVSEPRHAV